MYSRILVPLDGSELGERALPHVKSVTGANKAELFLIQVVSRAPEYEASRIGDFGNPTVFELARDQGRRLVEQHLQMAKQYLAHVAKGLETDGFAVHTIVGEGAAPDNIVSHAKDERVDLIVMSASGHGGVRRLILGSVADQVIRRSEVPVLIVPPK